MTTKAELISSLETNFDFVSEPVVKDGFFQNNELNIYKLKVMKLVNGELTFPRTVFFAVKDEGEVGTEEAYFIGKSVEDADDFETALETYIIDEFTFMKYQILRCNSEEEYAIVNLMSDNAGTIKEEKYFIERNKGAFVHKIFTGDITKV